MLLDGAKVLGFGEPDRERSDACLKRFETLLNVLQDQVFRLIADREMARDLGRMSRRDVLDYMEKVGAIGSSDLFHDAVLLRNRLSHVCPDDPAMQAGQINRAYAAAGTGLAAVDSVELWASSLMPPSSP
ncbi:MAG: hypothetical protein ACOYOH_12885 [Paracraurococcus sp.]